MRIAYISPYYRPAYVYGGPVNGSAALCEGLVRAGASVSVLTTDANGASRLDVPLGRAVDLDGVRVTYFPLAAGGLGFFYSPLLARAIADQIEDFDLALIAALWSHILTPAANACADHRVPFVLLVEGQLSPWALRQKRLKKVAYLELIARRYVDRAAGIRCTDEVEVAAIAGLKLQPVPFIVPNAVRTSLFATKRDGSSARAALRVPANAALLLFLGRIVRIKRPDIAVDVLVAAQRLPQDVHLVLAGPDEGGMAGELRRQAEARGCAGKLHFTGLLNQGSVASLFSAADLLLMPSAVQENFGMAAAEALAAGVPVLTSETVPVGKWAQQVRAGYVLPCTAQAFCTTALELLSDPPTLKAMGQRGSEMARRCFDLDLVGRQMLAQCEAIVRTGRPLPGEGEAQLGLHQGSTDGGNL